MRATAMKSTQMKKHRTAAHPRRPPKQADARCTLNTRIKDMNCSEVFDGSWPDGETINFVKNGLIEAGW